MLSFSRPKSILCLFPKKPGGEYITSRNICHKLSELKKLKVVIKEIRDYRFLIPKGKLRLLRNFLFNLLLFIKVLKKVFQKINSKLDYIYSPSILLLFLTRLFPKLKKAKIIYHFHGFDYGEDDKGIFDYVKGEKLNLVVKYFYLLPFLYFFSLLEGHVLKKAWKIFVPTQYSASLILKRYAFIDKKKIYIVPNGYEKKFFSPANKIVKPPWKILYVGRLVREKGIEELIKSFKLLPENKYHLTIIYPQSEDLEFEEKVKSQTKGYKNIILMKNVPREKIAGNYRKSCLTVLPSETYFEQLPLVFLESLACGTPVLISKKIPGVLKYQKKINPSLILSKITPQEIAFRIKFFCQLPEFQKRLVKERCLEVAKNFSWQQSVKIFLNYLLNNK